MGPAERAPFPESLLACLMGKRILEESDGQDMIEYGLLVALVALACVAALSNFSTVISTVWSTLTANLSS
jgi:Flp pilus assembly pilin Flp